MKAYTDIEQAKKLADILPLESADMYWWSSSKEYYIEAIDDGDFIENRDIRAWSLAALLEAIPKCIGDYNIFRMDINDIDTSMWYDKIGYGVCNELPDITMEEPVDACVDMIVKLNELNLL